VCPRLLIIKPCLSARAGSSAATRSKLKEIHRQGSYRTFGYLTAAGHLDFTRLTAGSNLGEMMENVAGLENENKFRVHSASYSFWATWRSGPSRIGYAEVTFKSGWRRGKLDRLARSRVIYIQPTLAQEA